MNNELKHKAWQDMRLILDREMPEKKKNRGLWIWFLVGGLILGIVYFFNYSESDNNRIPDPSENINAPVAVEKSGDLQAVVAEVENKNNTQTSENEKSAIKEDLTVKSSVSNIPFTKPSIHNQQNTDTRSIIINSKSIVNKDNQKIAETLIVQNTTPEKETKTDIKTSNYSYTDSNNPIEKSSSNRENFLVIKPLMTKAPLFLKSILPVNLAENKEKIVGIITGQNKNNTSEKNVLHFGLFASGGLSTDRNNLKNFAGGVSLNLITSQKTKWTFSTGPGYNIFDIDNKVDLDEAKMDGLSFDNISLPSSNNSDLQLSLNKGSVVEWNSNLSFSQYISNRWFYILEVNGAYKMKVSDTVSALEDNSSSPDFSVLTVNKSAYSQIFKKWDLRPGAGIGYSLNKNFNISTMYNHGLIGWIKYPLESGDQLYFRQINLQVDYQF
ncbi:MAG: hypothetical protein IPM42_05410 [Saprospiraceae bacterium]|nr:hypothetical protein [Saprospiraceae bacterium]